MSIDHRRLGRELDLFDSDPLIGAGLPFWLPDGAAARHEVESYLRELERRDRREVQRVQEERRGVVAAEPRGHAAVQESVVLGRGLPADPANDAAVAHRTLAAKRRR